MFKRKSVACMVALCVLAASQTVNAQTVLDDIYVDMGWDPTSMVSEFVQTIGPIFVTLLTLSFAFAVGWKILKHFKRAT